MSRGQSQSRTQSGSRTVQRHKDKAKFDNVDIIDVDRCKASGVVIIDAPECSQWRKVGFGVLKGNKEMSSKVVISIDDEEDDGDEGGDLDSDATSSKKLQPTLIQSHVSSEESDSDDCEIFSEEANIPFKLSKCTRMHPGNGHASRNRFGLCSESEGSSSESDGSDCELIEDFSGKFREQWEKAAFKKKVHDRQSRFDDQVSASGSTSDPRNFSQVTSQENNDKEESAGCTRPFTKQCENAPICSNSSNASNERDNLSTCTTTFTTGRKSPVADSDHMANQASHERVRFEEKDDQVSEEPSMCRTQLWDDEDLDKIGVSSRNKEKIISKENSFCDTPLHDVTYVHHSRNGSQDNKPVTTKIIDEMGVKIGRGSFQDKEESVSERPTCCGAQSQHENQCNHDRATFQDMVDSSSEEANLDDSHRQGGMQANNGRAVFEDKEELDHVMPLSSKTHVRNYAQIDHAKAKISSGEASLSSGNLWNDTQIIDGTTHLQSEEKVVLQEPCLFNTQQQDEGETPGMSGMDARDADNTALVQNILIGGREKLKETDEYKRASEQEWASRQLQLQIQAEEAQRLRKRKKAENIRLLDMERRQRQRLEEVRETQKKDEETISLKEKFRADIKEELDRVEMKYRDMASLLRGLGIHVGGGPSPMPHEINAAYKQALLKFHPDRASRFDIRQQVEAEEIFKLISRLKEKLLPAV